MSTENVSMVSLSNGMPDGQAGKLFKIGLEMAKPEKPKVLVIPTARTKQKAYDKSVGSARNFYQQQLGLPFSILHDFDDFPDMDQAEEKLRTADVVHIPGGDTEHMMRVWKSTEFDALLKTEALGGLVIMGASAGAIAPYAWGHSDSLSYRVAEDEDWDYIPVDGLNLFNVAIGPHNNTERNGVRRSKQFENMFVDRATSAGTPIGLGLDNSAGVVVENNQLRQVSWDPENSGVTVLDKRGDKLEKHRMATNEILDLSELK